jgi:PAS domain S-box-containing protein
MSQQNGEPRPPAESRLLDTDERFQSFVEAAEDYAIVTLDPDFRVAEWSSGAERLLGWPASEIAGKPASHFLPAMPMQDGRRAAQCIRRDGSGFQAQITTTEFHDASGAVRAYAVVIRDTRAGTPVAEGPMHREAWVASVLASAMDAIITVDSAQQILAFNKAAEAMFHCSSAEVLGGKLERLIPHRLREAHARHVGDFAATGVTSRAMGHLGTLNGLRSNGGEFPIEASISQTEIDGKKLFTVILRDITQRRRAEERQSLLLLELAHRVKNTLAIVQSIVAQTRRFATPEAFHESLTGRLVALGSAHDLLTASEWAGATLADVVAFALAPYEAGAPAQRWTANGPHIWLASNEAVTLSLVFHELAANAAKYGSLSVGDGTVSVEWTLDSDVKPTAVTILWCEHGGPPVAPPSTRGFGSRLIEQAITHELAGEAALTFLPGGAECRLHLPLSQKVNVQQ